MKSGNIKSNRASATFIHRLNYGEVFVFGSNLAGRHGKGAAVQALRWGAKLGIGEGLMGNTYAIPTKNQKLKPLSLEEIKVHINRFEKTVSEMPEKNFLVTKIGCGYAGYDEEIIAPLFYEVSKYPNVYLPVTFWEIINRKKISENG